MANPSRTAAEERRRAKKKARARRAMVWIEDRREARDDENKDKRDGWEVMIIAIVIAFLWETTRALFWHYT